MDCLFVRDHLFSYLEAQLPGEEKAAFEEHLHACDVCSRLTSGFKSVVSSIENKRAEDPDPFIRTRTIQRIENELERSGEKSNSLFRRSLQPVMFSVLFVIAVGVGFFIGNKIDHAFYVSHDHDRKIQEMKSDLFIEDFIDENIMFFANH